MSREGEFFFIYRILITTTKRFQKWRLPIAFLNSGRKHTNPEPHETEDSLSGGGNSNRTVTAPLCLYRAAFHVVVQKLITNKNACR